MAKKLNQVNKYHDCWNTVGVWSGSAKKCDRLEQVIHCRNCDVFTKAGREVFERQPPAGYVVQWQNEIRHQQNLTDKGIASGMMFRIMDEWYTISSDSIVEIADQRTIHRVPHNTNKYITGIVNIGGEVNICFSLAKLLGSGDAGEENNVYHRLIVIKSDDQRFIFPVSEVLGIMKYKEDTIIPPPSTLDKVRKTYVRGVYKYKDIQVGILDIDTICRALEGIPA